MEEKEKITVEATVKSGLNKVWTLWSKSEHITQWNFASNDWCCPSATNDLRPNGKFSWRMEAKDGSMGFDFGGTYDKVVPNEHISYTLDDGRKVSIDFSETENGTTVTETFETENQNPADMQRQGWQAILDNFRKYVESNEID